MLKIDIICQSDATDEDDVCNDAEGLRLESPVTTAGRGTSSVGLRTHAPQRIARCSK
jgi:hypothetical protein